MDSCYVSVGVVRRRIRAALGQMMQAKRWLLPGLYALVAGGGLLHGGCDESQSFDWPGFDAAVVQAGRASLTLSSRPLRLEVSAEESPVTSAGRPGASEPIPATRAAILEQLKISAQAKRSQDRTAARQKILELGSDAIEPLLETITDSTIRPRYAEAAIGLAIRLCTRAELDRHPRGPIELRPLTADAGWVFDAVAEYLRRHPTSRANIGKLTEIAPLDRLPAIIEQVEVASGERQAAYIRMFCALTHTDFPVQPLAFCGNSSPVATERARREGATRQRESVEAIRAWWEQHRHEPYEAWASAAARGHVQAASAALAEYIQTLGGDEGGTRQRAFHIRDYPRGNSTRFGPSTYATLVEAFHKAQPFVQPRILYLIALTQHPSAAEFVSERLGSEDPNLQHAAIAGLRALRAREYADGVRQVLRATHEKDVAREAIEALHELVGAGALEDTVAWLKDPDDLVRGAARRSLKPYLLTHAEALREIASSHPDVSVARTLRALLDQGRVRAALSDRPPGEVDLEILQAVARSSHCDDREGRTGAIAIIRQHELVELLPTVIELLRSEDYLVRSAAVDAIVELGVPGLTLESGPRLLGYSLKLDRHIVAYCYAKFGRDALPLVEKVAMRWRAPKSAGTGGVALPAVGLLKVLLDERGAGVEDDIIELIKTVPHPYRYVKLLALFDGPTSAAVVGEFLQHQNGFCRLEAVRVTQTRKLAQHADRLYEIAMAPAAEETLKRAQKDYAAGKLSFETFERIRRRESPRPQEAFEATNALIDFRDPRAWKATVHCLEGEFLNWRKRSGVLAGPQIVMDFGARLSQLKESHRREMCAMLRGELGGENRSWVVVALTTALALQPEPADEDILWDVAVATEAAQRARGLAAVGLSKLGDARARPILRELARQVLTSSRAGRGDVLDPFAIGWMPRLLRTERVPSRRIDLLSEDVPRQIKRPTLDDHHVNLAAALRRLGDDTLADEARERLIDDRGEFNARSYRLLAGLVGAKAYTVARDWLERNDPALLPALPALTLAAVGDYLDREEVISLISLDEQLLLWEIPIIIERELTECADALVTMYEKLDGPSGNSYRTKTLDALCRLGDVRGLTLAACDPLLLLQMGQYLPNAPLVEFPAGRFKYNRVEDGLQVQKWYREHRRDLRWDVQHSQFRPVNPP